MAQVFYYVLLYFIRSRPESWLNWIQYFAYVYEKEAYFYNINGITAFLKHNPEIEVGIVHL